MTYDEISVGDTAARTLKVTRPVVDGFARVSGDVNPVHMDEGYAANTMFGKCIAHGMLAASQVSAVLGNTLPGAGAIYLSQSLDFTAPVFLDDTITTTVTVAHKWPRRRVEFNCSTTNQDGVEVLRGKAMLIAPKAAA